LPQAALRLLATPLAQVTRLPIGEDLVRAVAPLGEWNLLLLASLAVIAGFLIWLRQLRPLAQVATWGCGFRFPTARMSYTGEGYAELAGQHLLPGVMRPEVSGGRVCGLFPPPTALAQHSTDPVLMRVLHPLFVAVAERCQWLHWLQQGRMPVYLVYIFVTSVVLMVWSLWAGGHGGG
jgi:hypothetical protein